MLELNVLFWGGWTSDFTSSAYIYLNTLLLSFGSCYLIMEYHNGVAHLEKCLKMWILFYQDITEGNDDAFDARDVAVEVTSK